MLRFWTLENWKQKSLYFMFSAEVPLHSSCLLWQSRSPRELAHLLPSLNWEEGCSWGQHCIWGAALAAAPCVPLVPPWAWRCMWAALWFVRSWNKRRLVLVARGTVQKGKRWKTGEKGPRASLVGLYPSPVTQGHRLCSLQGWHHREGSDTILPFPT